MMKKTAIAILFLLTVSVVAAAQQDKSKRPSPPAQAQCKFSDGKTITVDYSSPRAKGRKIFGGLVPYGEVWRTGANEATSFITEDDVFAAKTKIPAGHYTIFTVPETDKWTLIINKQTGEWGIPYKYQSEELARVPMTVSKLPSPADDFTISLITPAAAAPCTSVGKIRRRRSNSPKRTPICRCRSEPPGNSPRKVSCRQKITASFLSGKD